MLWSVVKIGSWPEMVRQSFLARYSTGTPSQTAGRWYLSGSLRTRNILRRKAEDIGKPMVGKREDGNVVFGEEREDRA